MTTTLTLTTTGAPMPPWPDLEQLVRAIDTLLSRIGARSGRAARRHPRSL